MIRNNVLLEVLVEPTEEGTLPENTVLRTEHPVVLVGEKEELGGNAAQTGCREGTFGLGVLNAEITLAVNAENGVSQRST